MRSRAVAATALSGHTLRWLMPFLLAKLTACTSWRMYDEPEASYTQARRLPQPRFGGAAPAPPPPWFEREYANALYVDQVIGNDANNGQTHAQALASITRAIELASHDTVVYVGNGTYTNNNYGRGPGYKNNPGAVSIRDIQYLKLTNLEGHRPKIAFDGSSGVSCVGVDHFQITGFEIEGPNKMITYEEAMDDRLIQSNRYTGRGIAVWSGDHIRIANNVVVRSHSQICPQPTRTTARGPMRPSGLSPPLPVRISPPLPPLSAAPSPTNPLTRCFGSTIAPTLASAPKMETM